MSDKFNIKLNIAGKSYPLTIERSSEEVYRRAEREINALVAAYKNRFRAQQEDYLAMAALQLAVGSIQQQMSRSLGEEIDLLVELDRELGTILENI